ncbi:uncharacterized protein ALTATR162_LOCUS553 [Alternaria atra]|uniref:Myb-like domain-containing protein n=1 Tax=Alternaria atra TaxID=119953 RepID=A0A8J2MW63_9PLEO|nr:uncharacterized protein ALTATR162_LOCUS553 [Alternaria atra]CAG5139727.1 unnamed protein product [Alternaria atra]
MTKRLAESPLVPQRTPKKPKTTKKTADIEAAPIDRIGRSRISETTASTEEEAALPVDDDQDTSLVSDEVASTPQDKKGAKASTPKKKGQKALAIKENGVKASVPKEGSKAGVSKAKAQKPPVGDGFLPYVHTVDKPPSNPFWGRKPISGDPRPHPDQPSARASNGQTNPPLFENRGYRYKRGTRYVKHHYNLDPHNIELLPQNRDQVDLLPVPLIDKRPKHPRKDPEPKQIPEVYCYGRVPKDWQYRQSIKALNDRRYQAIDRVTMDGPWTRIEQHYLASLLQENPDASIWEITELHNDRFMNKDFKENIGFAMGSLSTGRTVESVRYQYTAYKPFYDRGQAPVVRWRGDKSVEGIALAKKIPEKFGPPSKAEERAHDKAHGGTEESDDDDDTPKMRSPEKEISGNANPFLGQDKLDDDEEELLALAVDYNDDDTLPSLGGDDDAEETEEMIEEQDRGREIQVDSDVHATRDIEVDENYDNEL